MPTLFLNLPPHLLQLCSVSSFSPSPWAYLISPPPDFTCRHCFSPSLYPILTPPSHPVTERPSTWMAPPPAGFHRSSAFPYPVLNRQVFITQAVPSFPRLVAPHCHPQHVPRSLLDPGFSRPGVSSSLCLPLSTSRPPPSLLASTAVPVLYWPKRLRCMIHPPSPVHLPRPT